MQNDTCKVCKRADAIEWDDYFMSVAFLSAMRSKDPSTQVGACIVSMDKKIVGIGYNGFPRGCRQMIFMLDKLILNSYHFILPIANINSDDSLPWARTAESDLDTKYPYVVHAEINAVLNKNSANVHGCSVSEKQIYTNLCYAHLLAVYLKI